VAGSLLHSEQYTGGRKDLFRDKIYGLKVQLLEVAFSVIILIFWFVSFKTVFIF